MHNTTGFVTGFGNGIDRGTTDCIKRDGMGNGIDRDGS
jgi:hypothetical protein